MKNNFSESSVMMIVLRTAAVILSSIYGTFVSHAQIPEPETIFYGKIINRSSGYEALITQGTLRWVINRPDGKQLSLSTTIAPRNGGEFSYELPVPQEAVNFGLSASLNSLPLPGVAVTCSHLEITVDGAPARIMVPGSSVFAVAQNFRGSTYRLDLEFGTPMNSSSGDGIPDWWKNRYGVIDPNGDPDGDGLTNLQEFQMGSDPRFDNRAPQLLNRELFVYADGTTGIRLRCIDCDSSPSNIVYTLAQVPSQGQLYFCNSYSGTNRSTVLAGHSFTQQDIDQGRLLYVHAETNRVLVTSMNLILRDENPAHQMSTNVVRINLYRPMYPDSILQTAQAALETPAAIAPIPGLYPDEHQMLINYFLSRDYGYIIWDASRAAGSQAISAFSSRCYSNEYAQFVAASGPEPQHVLVGGAGNDRISGGMEDDILVAARGDDFLFGSGGADLFVIQGGHSTIADFAIAQGDVIDISRVLNGTSSNLNDYVQVSNSGSNTVFAIAPAGIEISTNMGFTVSGVTWTQSDLGALVESGSLVTGNKLLPPTISIAATANASQNGPTPGGFTLTRSGSCAAELQIQLSISGSAVNGRDYQTISSQWTFASGKRVMTIPVGPYVNTLSVTQTVCVAVLPGTGYGVGTVSSAIVQIEPLAPQITIEALQPIVSKSDASDGIFLVSRAGILDRSVLVRLTIGGTAPPSHYSAIPSFINLLPQQTTALIVVTPKPEITLSNGVEFVQVSIKPDPAYRVMQPSSARVIMVDQMMNFALWRQKFFPNAPQDGLGFAYGDSGNTGIPNIFRYAFGLDAQDPSHSRGRPDCNLIDGRMVLSFRRPFAVSDLDYSVEVSEDLLHWRAATEADLSSVPPANSNDIETVTYQTRDPVADLPKLFMRVRVVPQ